MRISGAVMCLLTLVFLTSGCGSKEERNHVKGTVKFKGQPVARGMIYFSPDLSKKSDGLQGIAEIKDGNFDTREGGKGSPLGAVKVRVEAFDGKGDGDRPMGSGIFVYVGSADVAGDIELNLDLKAGDVKKPGTETGGHVGP